MPVYADTALTAGAIDVLYGLLGSAGIIAAHEGTDAEKRAATQDIFNKMSAEEQQLFLGGMSGLEYINTDMTGYKFKNTDTFTYDKDWFYNLAQSAITAISSGLHFVVPSTGTPVTDIPNITTLTLFGHASDNPVFVYDYVGVKGARGVMGFTNDYKFVNYYVTTAGKVVPLPNHLKQCSSDSYIEYRIFPSSRPAYFLAEFSIVPYLSDGVTLWAFSSSVRVANQGLFYGLGSTDDYNIIGTVDLSGLSLGTVIGTVNPDVNCDEWATTMSDAISDNKDVIILDGKDLANYDTADDVRNGIITGVDWTGSTDPDIPVDDGTILGKLDSLLKWLAGLPALLGNAVIGSGSLDFSKFKNIDLSTVFPFCIPFDLINSFKGFNAVAVEPKWVVDFDQTVMKAGQVELDLTQFDSIFSIVRYFIYAGFVVSLILATRSLVKG